MKYILFAILAICLFSTCSTKKESESNDLATMKTEEAQRFDWLLGNWLRVNEAEGKTTYEKWVIITPFHYEGEGYTIDAVNKDTLSSERMHIQYKDDVWKLGVSLPNSLDTTFFAFTDLDSLSFVCYNPLNEFPKTIIYKLESDTIKAAISDSSMVIPYIFARVK